MNYLKYVAIAVGGYLLYCYFKKKVPGQKTPLSMQAPIDKVTASQIKSAVTTGIKKTIPGIDPIAAFKKKWNIPASYPDGAMF